MDELIFVSHNTHKLEEVRAILGNKCQISSLSSIGCFNDIAETGVTLQANAEIKARYVYERYGVDCFSDDTGLEIEALNMAPGVYSARYAGEECDAEKNRAKLLRSMLHKSNRRAQFRTVVALIKNGETYFFEGIVKGTIAESEKGISGFGYDRLFIPDGYDKTFAELPIEIKNNISHRAQALRLLADFLRKTEKK